MTRLAASDDAIAIRETERHHKIIKKQKELA